MKETFAKAKRRILDTLKSNGWEVSDYLKIPWAQHKEHDIKLYFKPQAIYETQYGQPFSGAMSTWTNSKDYPADSEAMRLLTIGQFR